MDTEHLFVTLDDSGMSIFAKITAAHPTFEKVVIDPEVAAQLVRFLMDNCKMVTYGRPRSSGAISTVSNGQLQEGYL